MQILTYTISFYCKSYQVNDKLKIVDKYYKLSLLISRLKMITTLKRKWKLQLAENVFLTLSQLDPVTYRLHTTVLSTLIYL